MRPFERVLVRNNSRELWKCDFFSHFSGKDKFPYHCMFGEYRQCIPYIRNREFLRSNREGFLLYEPFLVRDSPYEDWSGDLFYRYNYKENEFVGVYSVWKIFLPYKVNKDVFQLYPRSRLKPFLKVLVRNNDDTTKWKIDLFLYENRNVYTRRFRAVSGFYDECVPYSRNKYLFSY